MIRRRATLITLVTILPLISGSLGSGSAQSGSPPSTSQTESGASLTGMVMQLEVRRVPLDVVVTDRDGNPVRGLMKNDFIVKEDGKRQRILSFDYEDGSLPSYVPPKLPALPANTFVNVPTEPERGPLYVLYFDMLNTSRDVQMAFHEQLLNFVDSAERGARFAVFANTTRLRLIQGFTSDRARIHAALLSQGPGPHLPKVFLGGPDKFGSGEYGAGETGPALWNLTLIANYLKGLPGRKNVIWLASGFPIPTGPSLSAATNPLLLQSDAVKHTYDELLKGQIALYPVDLKGVVVGHSSIATSASYQDEDDIAQSTGGHAYHGDNGIRFLMDEAVTHGSSFYSLSYAPSNLKYDGSERHIEVTLARKGDYKLSYRRFYYGVPEPAGPPPSKTADTLFASIEHGAPMMHDLLFSVHLAADGAPRMATAEEMQQLIGSPAFFRTRSRNGSQKPLPPVPLQKYRIQYGVFDSLLKATAHRKGAPALLEFAVAAYDVNGSLLNGMLNDGVASPEPGKNGSFERLFHAEQELEVPPGAAYLRMVVRDMLNDQTGALEVPLPLKSEIATEASRSAPHP
jgi:VWFA-related protein